ncbi:MAG: alpha/beta hydrolase [Marinoscillum sp.]
MRKLFFLFTLLGFISLTSAQNSYSVEEEIIWASPDGFDLTMDIYTPETGKSKYPVLVIFHGGGWLINDNSIMDDMSRFMVENGEYVVCNVNYRLLVDMNNTVTMNQIVEDALGAVVWVQHNIAEYNGDPDKVAVTGDSAGGHLAEMVVIVGTSLSDSGFNQVPFGFKPSYLPEGVTASKLMKTGGIEVQAAVISYGAFDIYASALGGFEQPSNFFWQMGGAKPRSIFGGKISADINPEYYKAVSPIHLIPISYERKLPPQFFTVGSEDNLTTPKSIEAYLSILSEADQPAKYWVHQGRPHAFMDSGSNDYLGISWEKDGVPAAREVLKFLDEVFY